MLNREKGTDILQRREKRREGEHIKTLNKKSKVYKRGLYIVFIFVMTLFLVLTTACSGKKVYAVEEEVFMQALCQEVSFACQLQQVKPEAAGAFFTFETPPEKMVMYMGAGAYADCAGIFTAASEGETEALKNVVERYKQDLRASFEDYIPAEAEKVDTGIVVQKGRYVVLCITTEHEAADTWIDAYFEDHLVDEDAAKQPADTSGGEAGNQQQDGHAAEENGDPETSKGTVGTGYPVIEMQGKLKDYGNVITVGDTGYELYSYTASTAEKYAEAVNRIAKALEGKTQVYTMPIPLSSGITLPDALYGEISSSSQEKAITSIEKLLDDRVTTINPYENLMAHRDEYIYFRTDHHWTADGAYYAYEQLCREAGLTVIPRADRESVDFKGFLGSFYKDTGKDKNMQKHPDEIKAYYPVAQDVGLTYTTTNGQKVEWQVIHDVEDYDASLKYSTFIAGDNPVTVIVNRELKDGPKCVVVKESFGNALVPYLVDHYAKIYVIDYRYWRGNLAKYAEKKGADDLYFLNNLSMIRSDYLVGKLAGIC